MRVARSLACALLCTLAACRGDSAPTHILWTVEGERNTVYLLGSVHVLRPNDYPLPAAFEAAYADAERLVMELDMDELSPVTMAHTMLAAGMIDDGGSLESWLGPEAWRQATAAAAEFGFALDYLQSAEPWFAALAIVESELARLGFDPMHGIEMHFTARALDDGKPIDGLETLQQQVALFDEMPRETQRRFLLKAIEDAQELDASMQTMIAAWRAGEVAALERELTDSFSEFPAVYRSLVVERNMKWIATIEQLLVEPDDYLVIVGALHLVGPDSVVELLERRGYRVRRR